MQYIREMDLGFNKEHVIDIHVFKDEAKAKIELYKREILESPMIISAGASAFQPGSANFNQSVKWEGQEEDMSMFLIPVDKDYLETMQFQYLEGDPDFIRSMPDSAYTWVLNETARKLIGWEQAYGKQFTAFSSAKSMRPVAGVIRDFNFMSLHHEVGPLALVVGNAFDMDRVSVRVRGEDVPEALVFLRDKFREVMPDIPFEYSFFEDSIDHLYRAEIRSGNIVSVLTAIIIGIALFGLLGLISFSLEERTREIAIRKVHGIGIPRLSFLLTRNYILLVLTASFLAVPAAWYIMDLWLMNFAYRTGLSAGIFILTIMLTLILVFLTIVFRTLKAARSNPADALKYE